MSKAFVRNTIDVRGVQHLFLESADGKYINAQGPAVVALQTEVDLLRGAMAAQDERDAAACARAGIPPSGCDSADALADEVLALRAQLAAAREMFGNVRGLVAKWPTSEHGEDCYACWPGDDKPHGGACNCNSDQNNTDRLFARRAVGLEG